MDKAMISGFFNAAHEKKVFMDLKGLFNREDYLTEDYIYWRL
jgi:UDP-N-acetyl-D-galactosamine dehydrogenase